MIKWILILLITIQVSFGGIKTARADETIGMPTTINVVPRNTDLQFEFTAVPDTTLLPQETIITYTIKYGSHLFYDTPIKLEATWDQAAIYNRTDYPELLDYVNNSATNAYNSTPPIIDPVTRTITWDIPSFPQQTLNQSVSFSLKTNENYTGQLIILISAKAMMGASSLHLNALTATNQYQYISSPNPVTPSITPQTTQAPSSQASPTSIPEKIVPKNGFVSIVVHSINSNSFNL